MKIPLNRIMKRIQRGITMSEFTQIIADDPVVIPAVVEKRYDKKWLSHIRINSPSPDSAIVIANLNPYNGEDVLPEPKQPVIINNIFEAMQDEARPVELRTLMAQTMELIIQTIKAEVEYQKTLPPLSAV